MARPAPVLFGKTPMGDPVHSLAISGGGLSARILTWGAVVQDLRMAGHVPPLVLGYSDFADYPAHSPYFGAIAGRYANRIRDGRFDLDGQTYQLDQNFLGKHHLHGGAKGIGKRVWRIDDFGTDFVRLMITCRDGEMGYPARAEIACTYRLVESTLKVTLEATCDAPTLINLAHHSYFNLEDGGATDILGHHMRIAADNYTPVDDELIPTGIKGVTGTPHDFRVNRIILESDDDGAPIGYDHNYCVADARRDLTPIVWVKAPQSGVAMEVLSTEPGVQFYAGAKVGGRPANGLIAAAYDNFAGFCLEPQVWPDSPNHPEWPQARLNPDETYQQETHYRFSKS